MAGVLDHVTIRGHTSLGLLAILLIGFLNFCPGGGVTTSSKPWIAPRATNQSRDVTPTPPGGGWNSSGKIGETTTPAASTALQGRPQYPPGGAGGNNWNGTMMQAGGSTVSGNSSATMPSTGSGGIRGGGGGGGQSGSGTPGVSIAMATKDPTQSANTLDAVTESGNGTGSGNGVGGQGRTDNNVTLAAYGTTPTLGSGSGNGIGSGNGSGGQGRTGLAPAYNTTSSPGNGNGDGGVIPTSTGAAKIYGTTLPPANGSDNGTKSGGAGNQGGTGNQTSNRNNTTDRNPGGGGMTGNWTQMDFSNSTSSLSNFTGNGTFPYVRSCYSCVGKSCGNLTSASTCQSATGNCYAAYDVEKTSLTLGCQPLIPRLARPCNGAYLSAATYCEYCCTSIDYCNDHHKLTYALNIWCSAGANAPNFRRLWDFWLLPAAIFALQAARL